MKITRRQIRQLIREVIDDSDYTMPVSLRWHPYRDYAYLDISDISRLRVIPPEEITQAEAAIRFNDDQWSIMTLQRYVFGDVGQHGYTHDSYTGLETHPELNKEMLPPSWTIAAQSLMSKTDDIKDEFYDKARADDREGVMQLAAAGGYSKSLRGAADLKQIIDSMELFKRRYGHTF